MLNRTSSPHLPFGDRHTSWYYGKDILSVDQFQSRDIDYLFGVARELEAMVKRVGSFDLLKGKVIANLFYEPSTRTSSSFAAAMMRLGGAVIPINEVKYSSVAKGETLEDTVRSLECYVDAIVLRHPQVGAAAQAAKAAHKPIINAGDGEGEHPTQALLDLYTIEQCAQQLSGVVVAMVGDLKYGRTVHSLARLLTLYGAEVLYVSPDELAMPEKLVEELQGKGLKQTRCTLEEAVPACEVLYVTRIQKERLPEGLYERVKGQYQITPTLLTKAHSSTVVMHPLPRVDEIVPEVDSDPRAVYFQQMENGLYIRMALLAMVLGKA